MARKSSKPESETRFIHAPIEAVFRAFIEPLTIKAWLGAELDLVCELHGKYLLTAEGQPELAGTIEVLAWPEALAVGWEGGRFALSLEAEFGGTKARFESEGADLTAGALATLEAYLQRPGRR